MNDGFSRHNDDIPYVDKVSTIARIKSFFKSRFKSRPSDQK